MWLILFASPKPWGHFRWDEQFQNACLSGIIVVCSFCCLEYLQYPCLRTDLHLRTDTHLNLTLMSRTRRNHLSVFFPWNGKKTFFAHSIGLMCYIQIFFFSPISNCLEIVMWLVFFYWVSSAFTAAIESLGSDKKKYLRSRKGTPADIFTVDSKNVWREAWEERQHSLEKNHRPTEKYQKCFRTVGVHDQTRSYHRRNKT